MISPIPSIVPLAFRDVFRLGCEGWCRGDASTPPTNTGGVPSR
jgi:hypothetical protein